MFALGGGDRHRRLSVTRYFGLRNYGVLLGTIVGLLTFAAGVGPMIGGISVSVVCKPQVYEFSRFA